MAKLHAKLAHSVSAPLATPSPTSSPIPVPTPTPTPSPTLPPSPSPSPSPEPSPKPSPSPTGTPTPAPMPTPTPSVGECVATPGLNNGVSDAQCAKCATGYKFWPCNFEGYCQGECGPTALLQMSTNTHRGFLQRRLRHNRALA